MEYKKIAIGALILLTLGLLFYFSPALIPTNPPTNGTTIDSGVNFSNEPLKVTIFSTTECKAFCDTDLVVNEIEKRVGKIQVNKLEITSSQAADALKNYTVQTLPVYVIDAQSLEKNLNSRELKELVRKINDKSYVLDTIETKSGLMYGRTPQENNVIDYFTSPYTKEGVDFYKENFQLLKNFSDSFNVKYELVTVLKDKKLYPVETNYWFSLNESRRQACINQLYPKWALDYAACRNNYISKCFATPNANLDFCSANWKTCALAYASFNLTDIENCAETQADALLLDMRKKAGNRLVNAIPTVIVNDKYILVGQFNSTYLKTELCKLNTTASACKT